jgi:hypothetical protein
LVQIGGTCIEEECNVVSRLSTAQLKMDLIKCDLNLALTYCFCWLVGFMVFNAILNNISVGVSNQPTKAIG